MDGSHDRTSSRPRIVIADDSEDIREALREMLDDLGFDVVGVASDGREAVTLVGLARPDLVLMDIRMPHLDGIEATRLIRERDPAIPVILLSASDEARFEQPFLGSGAVRCLTKGCSVSVLESELRAVLALGSLHLAAG